MRKQTAIWWPLGGINSGGNDYDNFGQPLYADPVQIDCRWDDTNVEIMLPDNTTYMSRATVYVDRDVALGGLLMRGVLADITDPVNPRQNNGAWEIKRSDDIPNFKATEFLKIAYL